MRHDPANGGGVVMLRSLKMHGRWLNLFAKLKDWRRIATRYDRCAHTFFSAICITAALILWIRSMCPEPIGARSAHAL